MIFAKEPYSWAPDVTRRQRLRDLRLLLTSHAEMDDEPEGA